MAKQEYVTKIPKSNVIAAVTTIKIEDHFLPSRRPILVVADRAERKIR
jgi:hypothetical protein